MNNAAQINSLLELSLGACNHSDNLLEDLAKADREQRTQFLSIANSHHVILRTLDPLRNFAQSRGYAEVAAWCGEALSRENVIIADSLKFLANICQKLESAGIQITVMKSLDHWPDIGNDLDLYTTSNQREVTRAMVHFFEAHPKGRTCGDRLAQKWNFGVKGLAKSVEIHHGYLGQTGEHIAIAERFRTRRIPERVGGYTFMVPAPEERIIAATLQRMYRHLYIRVCDIVNTHFILESGKLDFAELKYAADLGGIWPGVATYLRIVTEFVSRFRGVAHKLDRDVLAAARIGVDKMFVRGIWIRVPVQYAAQLYSKQLFSMASRRDFHGVFRLSLLPPLASVARLSYMVTGNHSGIW
jgi:hypothetical protein